MKVLVTGGAGFIGSNFIHFITKERPDWVIINLDKLTYAGNLENLNPVKGKANHRFIKGDICDRKLVYKLMKGVDTVIHFAAESHVDRSVLEPGIFIETNIIGTHVLLQAAVERGVKKFHHISTDEVFGALDLESEDKFHERTPYSPRSPYSSSKAASDHLVRAYGETYGLKYSITNCSNNYGPYQFPEKIIPLFIANALENKPLPIYGDGKSVRDYLYVEDHCKAILDVIERGTENSTYCIGGNSEVSGIQMAETILELLGKPKSLMRFVKDRPGHDRRYAVNFEKINKELDWKPSVSFKEGIKKTIRWYVDNVEWLDNVKSGEYQNFYEKQYKHRLKD